MLLMVGKFLKKFQIKNNRKFRNYFFWTDGLGHKGEEFSFDLKFLRYIKTLSQDDNKPTGELHVKVEKDH